MTTASRRWGVILEDGAFRHVPERPMRDAGLEPAFSGQVFMTPDGAHQLDLFDSAASDAVKKIDTFPLLPSRSVEWDVLLAGSKATARLVIHVSTMWLQVVLEQFVDPALGRRILWNTGTITRYPAAPHERPSHTVYLTADAATAMHARMPLVALDRGATYARFRPAGAGEVGPVTLELPTLSTQG